MLSLSTDYKNGTARRTQLSSHRNTRSIIQCVRLRGKYFKSQAERVGESQHVCAVDPSFLYTQVQRWVHIDWYFHIQIYPCLFSSKHTTSAHPASATSSLTSSIYAASTAEHDAISPEQPNKTRCTYRLARDMAASKHRHNCRDSSYRRASKYLPIYSLNTT